MTPSRADDRFAVVGGGIVGLCVARRLAQLGREVVLVERTRLGAGASGASAGLLEPPSLARSTFQKRLAASFDGYASFVRDLSAETTVAVEFRESGSLHLAFDAGEADALRRRAERLELAGVAVRWLERHAVAGEIAGLSERVEGGLLMLRSARVHPPDLLEALAVSLRRHGGRLLEGVRRVELERAARPAERRSDYELHLEGAGGVQERFPGYRVVVCAGAWTDEVLERSGLRAAAPVVPVRGQMVELQVATGLPYVVHVEDRYLIPRPRSRVWVGATVEEVGFDDRVTEAGRESLLESARRVLPALDESSVRRAWSGLRPKLMRRGGALLDAALADTANVAVLAGHYRNGILAAPRDADRLVAELLGVEMANFSPFS